MANATATSIYQNTHTATVGGTAIDLRTFLIAKDCLSPDGTIKNAFSTSRNRFNVAGTNVEVKIEVPTNGISLDVAKEMPKTIMIPVRKKEAVPNNTFIDLRRMEYTFTINGHLADDDGNITNTSPAITSTALNKKLVLLAMAEEGGPIRLYWRNEAFQCALKSLHFGDVYTETMSTDTTSVTYIGVVRIDFTMTLTLGSER